MPVRIRSTGSGTAVAPAPGSSNTRSDVTPAIALTQRMTVLHGDDLGAGVAVAQGPLTARIAQTPGIAITENVTGTPVVAQTPALVLTQRFAQSGIVQTPALEMVQVTYNLTKLTGGNAATQTAVGARSDWASIANATGSNNGTNATFAGDALGARSGRLDLAYANVTGKTDLTITLVQLLFYGSVAGTGLNNADVRLEYDLGGAVTTLETITGDATFSATPKTHDITAAVGGLWSNIDALNTHVRAESALGELWTANLDAVMVRVLANVTDPL